jgi:drug/metabolite transporter (DMT)-like permease
VVGPVLGVTLSLVALSASRVGVASTLMALTPVFLLPLSWLVFRERMTWRSVVGTALAVGGVAVLWLA